MQATVRAGHHLLDLGRRTRPPLVASITSPAAPGTRRRLAATAPPAQGATDVENTDQNQDEEEKIAHDEGSSDKRRQFR